MRRSVKAEKTNYIRVQKLKTYNTTNLGVGGCPNWRLVLRSADGVKFTVLYTLREKGGSGLLSSKT